MSFYMDRHDLEGVTAADIAAAHVRDVAAQDAYGVRFIHYWFDYERQHAFCLADGPSAEAVDAVHRVSHGLVPNQIIEVDESAVTGFLGAIVPRPVGEAYVETAFRAILFTDIAGSTSMTQVLGDAAAMGVVRRHDDIVRDALRLTGGTQVKHTGDGVMASFVSAAAAIRAALAIQSGLERAEAAGEMPVGVRIGIAAGEPVADGNDLFGAAVQLAARLSSRAAPRSILVSGLVADLAAGEGFTFRPRRSLRLKGFARPVPACEVEWRPTGRRSRRTAPVSSSAWSPSPVKTSSTSRTSRAWASPTMS
jgi:class 3 adenylate cyclase